MKLAQDIYHESQDCLKVLLGQKSEVKSSMCKSAAVL